MNKNIKIGDVLEYARVPYDDPNINIGDTIVVTKIISDSDGFPIFIEFIVDDIHIMRRANYFRIPIKKIRKAKLEKIYEQEY